MGLEEMYRGADYEIEIQVVDDETALPINISAAINIYCVLYYPGSDIKLDQYALNTEAGYKPLDISNATLGKYEILLEKAVTKDADLGPVYAETKIIFANNDFYDNDFDSIARDTAIGELKDSQTKDK